MTPVWVPVRACAQVFWLGCIVTDWDFEIVGKAHQYISSCQSRPSPPCHPPQKRLHAPLFHRPVSSSPIGQLTFAECWVANFIPRSALSSQGQAACRCRSLLTPYWSSDCACVQAEHQPRVRGCGSCHQSHSATLSGAVDVRRLS